MAHAPTVNATNTNRSIDDTDSFSATLLARVIRRWRYWQTVNEIESELSALSDSMLRDVGLSRCDISGLAHERAAQAIKNG